MADGFTAIVVKAISANFMGWQWWESSIIALFISVSLAAIGWMLSEFLKSKELKGWAKEEINQFIYSAILVAMLYPLLLILNLISVSFFGEDYFTSAQTYLVSLENSLITVLSNFLSMKVVIYSLAEIKIPLAAILSSAAVTSAFTGVGFAAGTAATIAAVLTSATVEYFRPIEMIATPIDIMLKGVTPALVAVIVQLELLDFIKNVMFQFILPLGIVMRAFTITRKIGSTLIAFSLVMFIVYPLSLNFAAAMYNTVSSDFKLDLITFAPPTFGKIQQIMPAAGTYYMSPSDYFKWSVADPRFTYRIWFRYTQAKSSNIPDAGDTSTCPSTGLKSWDSKETDGTYEQPPLGEQYGEWHMIHSNGNTIDCLKIAKVGNGVAGTPVIFYMNDKSLVEIGSQPSLSSLLFPFGDGNETMIVFDAYNISIDAPTGSIEGATKLGFAPATVYLGNACSKNLWNYVSCILGAEKKSSPNAELTALNQGKASMSGAWAMIKQLGSVFKRIVIPHEIADVPSLVWSPSMASRAFLSFTDDLPLVFIRVFMVVFTLSFSITVSLSMFRSISMSLGGESEISELSRLI